MRKAACMVVTTVVAGLVLSGCGGGDGEKADSKPSGATTAAKQQSPSSEPSAERTMIERAAGSWKSIVEAGDGGLDTLTIADGKVTAKGPKLDCTGTLKEGRKAGKEAPTLTLSCKGGDDGGRGVGTVGMKDDDKLAINWAGPEGGYGGPVESFRRVGG
ncbi:MULTISPECIES: hypothetical protein [unclassified Streptomyces]|uniref:hypothetical protein n=1 Tax=unclassified Streptomyces TaxID=2593676 RepID=UPI00336A9470